MSIKIIMIIGGGPITTQPEVTHRLDIVYMVNLNWVSFLTDLYPFFPPPFAPKIKTTKDKVFTRVIIYPCKKFNNIVNLCKSVNFDTGFDLDFIRLCR